MPPKSMAYAELNAPYEKGMANVKLDGYTMFGFRDDLDVFAEFYLDKDRNAAESNWKGHVSILTTHLEKGWNLVYPVLVAEGVHHFKVARQSALMNKSKKIATDKGFTKNEVAMGLNDLGRLVPGMQITIYVRKGKEKEMQAIFAKVEKALANGKVTPGEIDKSDKALGKYVSIRNDGGPNGYQSHDLVSGYNPANEKDPFKAL